MISSDSNERLHPLTAVLDGCHPQGWHDIVLLLNRIKDQKKAPLRPHGEDSLGFFARGTAFISFSFGIDGVSIETSKYAQTLSQLFAPAGDSSIHVISGNFEPEAASILSPEWRTFQIDGIDGWHKWDDGKWFRALFRRKMLSHGRESKLLAAEVYRQAAEIARRLGSYFLDNHITLVVPVNVASNPGNIALTLGLVLATEILGIHVLNSNHDFYWESGKPLSDREIGEKPGVRDHFFRNIENRHFFSLFKRLYPWNGSRWLQVNINARQSRRLVRKFGFSKERISEVSTSIPDAFFQPTSRLDVLEIRARMGRILSDGGPMMHPVPIEAHLAEIGPWMNDQQPLIIGARPGLTVDPISEDLLILLQPTRIIGRKRIARNFDLIDALLQRSALRQAFQNNQDRQLILHITGPAPKEHQQDLEEILLAYKKLIGGLPAGLADRVFLSFSVGRAAHPSFAAQQLRPMTVEELFKMADVVLFPSQTEGRGLPIIEAGAAGIPIICSQYRPREVFGDVIGEGLPRKLRIQYTLFPEGRFTQPFLAEVAELLIDPASKQASVIHNREAVRSRYSYESFKNKFGQLLDQLYQSD